MAEQSTGCYGRSNLGTFFARGGVVLTPEAAAKAIRVEETVEVPSAGAGSYARFFAALGFDEATLVESSSSAGDWFLGVRDAATGLWSPAWQENRYLCSGFRYSMETRHQFASFKELCEHANFH